MTNLVTSIVAVALLSGCAIGPTYTVRMGMFDGDSLTYREKRHVDPEMAEDGGVWSNAEPHLDLGSCAFYRRKGVFLGDPPLDAHQYKQDIDCAVWKATEGREHKPRWYIQ